MYKPVQNGISKAVKSVYYEEAAIPSQLSDAVYCYWRLKTKVFLNEDFHYHVLPDACVDIVFDILKPREATVMTPGSASEVLNLGREFSYVGIRLLPGVWRKDLDQIIGGYKFYKYFGDHSVSEITTRLKNKDFASQQTTLTKLIKMLIGQDIIQPDPITKRILDSLDDINSVSDMARLTGLSTRQLQRKLKNSTGYNPHDLIKVLRLQQAFNDNYLSLYTDQSHFIHSFKKITSQTPMQYKSTYIV